MAGNSVLATVMEGGVYKLYLDGELVGQQADVAVDIKLSTMHVGIQPPGWEESNFNAPVFQTRLFMQPLTGEQVKSQSLALSAKYSQTGLIL